MSRPKLLEDAIEGLYTTFAGYPLPEDTGPCPCCHSPGANDLLHAAPLRQLEWTHLKGYATDAMMVWGDVEVFKHFLPRILDLCFSSPATRGVPNPESVFHRFRYGRWREWPVDERKAVEVLLQALWETVRSHPPIVAGYVDVDQWLCCIGQCADDLGPYLLQWKQDDRISAAWALSALVLGSPIAYIDSYRGKPAVVDGGDRETYLAEAEAYFQQPHPSAWWQRCVAQYGQLSAWVKSPEALAKLHAAETLCGNQEMAREFAEAQRCILEAHSTPFEPGYRNRAFQTAYWESSTNRLY